MYISTRGIVFRQIKYSDSSLVVRIMTDESGLRSYIVKGARGPKAKIKSSLFQPLTLLDLVVSHKEKSELHHIREARIAHPYQSIQQDIRKSSILLFLNELMYKSIQEEAVNPALFQFIYDHLVLLDQTSENTANFHLLFTIHLCRHLGFFPQGSYRDENTVFDLVEGHFGQQEPLPAENFITGQNCAWFSRLLLTAPGDFFTLTVPSAIRNELLEKLLRYYHLHLPLTGTFKSHLVLHEVLQK
jgi:DNA repair protein RecO (recombination protein O)